jgi:hypothetical protein
MNKTAKSLGGLYGFSLDDFQKNRGQVTNGCEFQESRKGLDSDKVLCYHPSSKKYCSQELNYLNSRALKKRPRASNRKLSLERLMILI